VKLAPDTRAAAMHVRAATAAIQEKPEGQSLFVPQADVQRRWVVLSTLLHSADAQSLLRLHALSSPPIPGFSQRPLSYWHVVPKLQGAPPC
jgi:hypothetical protein